MCLPAMTALQQTGHPLIICARSWAQPLTSQFEPVQFISLVGKFTVDRRAIAQISKQTRREALGLIMPDSLSSAALFATNGIQSCGYRDDGRSLLLRHACRQPDHPVHAVQKWWMLTRFAMQRWQITSQYLAAQLAPTTVLQVTREDKQQASTVLQAHGLNDQPFVLLAPTATGLHHGKVKVWPHYAALARVLRAQGQHVVICPPAAERDQAQATCPEALLLDPLPLKAFCALTQMAKLVICNDSGVSHLAASAGANQLTLFGVTDPKQTGPWSDHAMCLGSLGQWPDLEQVLQRVATSTNGDH